MLFATCEPLLFPTCEPSTPRSNDSLEVNWLGSAFYIGFSPRQFLTYHTLLDSIEDKDFAEQQISEGSNHIDPHNCNAAVRPAEPLILTPRAKRANRRNNSTPNSQPRILPHPATVHRISPQALREIKQLA
ncbi:hypothetical protein DFH28DRAFT_924793 [Melampsora americana]|nr:hypothetical protein DFH28DRAFT_924793 [Melampsora americana]